MLCLVMIPPVKLFEQVQKNTDDTDPAPVELSLRAPALMGGANMGILQTMYDKSGQAGIFQIPMTVYDKNNKVHPIGAERYEVLEDGMSDGVALAGEDYVISLERVMLEGYDFSWFWSWAGWIKNWSSDSKHFSSGPYMLDPWVRRDKSVMLKNPGYTGPWPAQLYRIKLYPALEDPAVIISAYLAGDLEVASLNSGQLPLTQSRFPDERKSASFFDTYYLAFDYDQEPFNDPNVRKPLYFAFDTQKAADMILKNVAIPAHCLHPQEFSGLTKEKADQTAYDLPKAKAYLAATGYPDGKRFPEVSLWWRIEGGTHAPIVCSAVQYAQAERNETLQISIAVPGHGANSWMDGLNERMTNFFLAPPMYDYGDASNYVTIFVLGERHNWEKDRYPELIGEVHAMANWKKRKKLYQDAEQVISSLFGWVGVCRLVRGQLLTTKNRASISASKSLGASFVHTISRHLLPNSISQIVVGFVLSIPGAIMLEASLSCLDVGVKLPVPRWGQMIHEGLYCMFIYRYLALFLPLFLLMTVFATSLFGDGLRDGLYSKMKGGW